MIIHIYNYIKNYIMCQPLFSFLTFRREKKIFYITIDIIINIKNYINSGVLFAVKKQH